MEEAIYLAHHGIAGQKWGEKNGPPYPLKTSQKSSKEKTAKEKDPDYKKVQKNKKKERIARKTGTAVKTANVLRTAIPIGRTFVDAIVAGGTAASAVSALSMNALIPVGLSFTGLALTAYADHKMKEINKYYEKKG